MSERLWLIIPVKMLVMGKQRLGRVLSDIQRRELAEAMLKDMLVNLKACRGVEKIVLVSKDAAVHHLAQSFTVDVLKEPEDCHSLNDAVRFALQKAQLESVDKALILHGDIPQVRSDDIERLIEKGVSQVCLVPDAHDNGTNGMLLALPSQMQVAYGESSFDTHLTLAHDLGLSCQILRSVKSLQSDIDEVEDLVALVDMLDPKSFTSQLLSSASWQNTLPAVAV